MMKWKKRIEGKTEGGCKLLLAFVALRLFVDGIAVAIGAVCANHANDEFDLFFIPI